MATNAETEFTLHLYNCALITCHFMDRCKRVCVHALSEWWHVHKPYQQLHV